MKLDKDGEHFCAINGQHKKPSETIFIATHQDNMNYDKTMEKDNVIFSQLSSIHSHKPCLKGM